MIQYHQSNPFRPVNWRWERARLIREGKLRGVARKNEDDWTIDACKFQRAMDRCKDEVDRYVLMERNPGLYYAWLAYRPVGLAEGNVLRYALEARLLSGETSVAIAEKLGCEADVVNWYERVFFNVSEKLKNPDYVMTCVIGAAVHTGLNPQEYDILWKVFGYLYGPMILDAFIHGTSTIHHADTPEDAEIALSGDVTASIRRKAAICARTYAINGFTQEGLMNVYARFLELERAADAGAAKDSFLSTVNVVLATLPFADSHGVIRPDTVTRKVPARLLSVDQPLLTNYDAMNAELRTDELLAVTSGRDLPNRADLEDMKFPEPPDVNSPKVN